MNDHSKLGAFRWDSGLVAMSPQSEGPKSRKVKMKKLVCTGSNEAAYSRQGFFRLSVDSNMAKGKV